MTLTPAEIPPIKGSEGARTTFDHMDGTLGERRAYEIMAALLAGKATGALVLTNRGVARRIVFEGGEPLVATSNGRDDRLTELLYREGRLTDTQREAASAIISGSGRRAGAVLVEKGFISARELFPLVRYHYETLIIDSFTWNQGTYHFEEGEPEISERILLELPAATLIMEGLRAKGTRVDADRLMPPGAVPIRRDRGVCDLEDLGLSSREMEILDWCEGERTTSQLARRFSMAEPDLRTVLLGLAVLGWVGTTGQSVAVGAGVRPVPVFVPETEVERARVLDKIAKVEEGTYFEILEVPQEATEYEIRKSHRRLQGFFDIHRFASEELTDLRGKVDVIRAVIDEAFEVLSDSEIREEYRSALFGGNREGPR
jgi:hypothetical protein